MHAWTLIFICAHISSPSLNFFLDEGLQRTIFLSDRCPLFGGFTVHVNMHVNMQ